MKKKKLWKKGIAVILVPTENKTKYKCKEIKIEGENNYEKCK